MKASAQWDVAPADWRRFLSACPNATFFHTPEWYQANARSLGYRVSTALLRFDDGAEALLPLGVLPAFAGLVHVAFAGIENGYGGLVSPRPLTSAHVEAAYRAVRRRYPELRVVGNPFEAYSNLPAAGDRQEDATQVLPVLAPEAQRKLMSETRVKHCKRAARAGFSLEVRTGLTAEDAARFFPLYARCAASWSYARWVRDEAYFRTLCEVAGEKLALLLATREGRLAGFRMLGLHGPVAMDLYLGTDPADEPLHVGPYLVAESLAWCRERGLERFDFQPSGRLEGVRLYKASFGAQPVAHEQAVFKSWQGRSLEALYHVTRGRQRSLTRRPRPA